MNLPERLVTEMPAGGVLRWVLIWQPIGLLLMASHVLLVRESIWLFPVMPLILGWLYLKVPFAGALVFFQILIYQNLTISLFTPGMDYTPTYVGLGGTNFVALCVVAIIALNRLTAPYWWQKLSSVIWLVLAGLAMLAFYSVIGAANAGPTSAMMYFRNFASPFFAVLVGLDLGRTWSFKTVGTAFIFSTVLSIGLSIIEYTMPADFYDWMNEVRFYQLKYAMQPRGNLFFAPSDIVYHFTAAFFNISGSSSTGTWKTFRFGGSIITPTSFAYLLSVTGLLAVSLRRSLWLVVIVPLMFLDGAKGASLLLVLSVALWWVWKWTANTRIVVVSGIAMSVGYVAFGIITGIHSNDYHVVGFFGGVHGLMSNPFGHGLGVGGNMSAEANAGFKMDGPGGFTRLGASFALESAVGVLFFQVGVASALYFWVFMKLVFAGPLGELRGNRVFPLRQDLLFFGVATIMVNGVFQEEAYSPYAAGTIMLLCSCIISNGRRQVVEYSPFAHRLAYKRASVAA